MGYSNNKIYTVEFRALRKLKNCKAIREKADEFEELGYIDRL